MARQGGSGILSASREMRRLSSMEAVGKPLLHLDFNAKVAEADAKDAEIL